MVDKKDAKEVKIVARDLGDLYFSAIWELLQQDENGNYKNARWYDITKGSYAGQRRLEFDSFRGIVLNPTQRPLAPTTDRAGIPLPTNDKDIEDYFYKYLLDGKLEPNEHYKYASWITGIPDGTPLTEKNIPRGTKLNQLEWCINHFNEEVIDEETGEKIKNYGTNHCYITIGCAEGLQRYDWANKSDNEKGSTECLRGIGLSIRKEGIKDNRLDLEVFFRSWDLVNGLPVNLGGLTMLMEYSCNLLGDENVRPGLLIANSSGLHMYDFSENFARIFTAVDEIKKGEK